MSRLWKAAALIAATCAPPLSAYALLSSEQPPPPETKAAEKKAGAVTKEPEKAAEKAPTDPIDRIKEEGLKRSKVMETLSYLSDVIGPRLTNSPGLKRANEWTRDTMAGWGMENAHLEAWGPFGRGWTLKRFSAQVVEPLCIPLIALPKAWSPGTDGAITGDVVLLDVKTDADFEPYKGKLKGAIVLLSQPVEVAARFEPLGARKTDKQLLDLADAAPPAPRGFGGGGGGGRRGGPPAKAEAGNGPPPEMSRALTEMRARFEVLRKRAQFVMDEGAAVTIDVSTQGDGGTLFVSQASVPSAGGFPIPGGGGAPGTPPARRASAWDKDAPKILPQLTMGKEHYNRLARMIKAGEKVKMSVDIAVDFQEEDLMGYNTVAEIPGTDLKDEVVMLGGHLDSWHGGTGATDNAAGCAAVMEAARILKALDLKPRRTVRVALWSGEEQGLLGSRAYVTKHFGRSPGSMFGIPDTTKTAEADSDQKAAHEKFSGYYNLDNGTGKIRGVYLQGNEAVRPIFRKWLAPFRDMGAQTLTVSNTGGTDHQSFDGVGLPGFQFIQDEVEYETRTHHSNMDVFDRIQAEDLKQAATIIAAFVYQTAIADEKLPRKTSSSTAAPASGPRAEESTKAAAAKSAGEN